MFYVRLGPATSPFRQLVTDVEGASAHPQVNLKKTGELILFSTAIETKSTFKHATIRLHFIVARKIGDLEGGKLLCFSGKTGQCRYVTLARLWTELQHPPQQSDCLFYIY